MSLGDATFLLGPRTGWKKRGMTRKLVQMIHYMIVRTLCQYTIAADGHLSECICFVMEGLWKREIISSLSGSIVAAY